MEIKAFLRKNAPTICTVAAVSGTTAAMVFAARGHTRARRIIDEHVIETGEVPTFTEDVKMTWKHYVPAAASYVLAFSSILLLNKAYVTHISAVVSAAAVSERILTEYVNKIEERLDSETLQEVRDEVAQDHIDRNPPTKEVIFDGDDSIIVRDGFSGRYFRSSRNEVQYAVNSTNNLMNMQSYASLTDFYEQVGLDQTDESDYMGWSVSDGLFGVEFGTAITPEGRPCLEYSFRPAPKSGYHLWN